ncbi:MAG: protoporphyrinogen/coproporphyrinogen oxidase [Planctomycetota bacterium]
MIAPSPGRVEQQHGAGGRAVVVGGGIAGLYAALLLRRRGQAVVLVEAEERLGGLLNSWDNGQGDVFDFGTHFIAGTEDPRIDCDILPAEWTAHWQKFPNEQAGNYFHGRLSPTCLFVDARALPAATYHRALHDLLEAPSATGTEPDLASQLRAEFGATLTEHLFQPALHKLFGVGLEALSPDAHLRFAMKRIVAFEPETARRLKALPDLDRKLAFHHFATGAAARPQYYPHTGGAGVWVRRFEEALAAAGVEVLTGQRVARVAARDGLITGVELSGLGPLDCSSLVWTTPLPPLFKAAGLTFSAAPPQLRRTVVVNLVLDRPPVPPCHFYFNYDPACAAFRVTLYSNMQAEQAQRSGRHRVTVEVLTDPQDLRLEEFTEGALPELKAQGVFPPETRSLFARSFEIKNGFPVLSHQFARDKAALVQLARESFRNLVLLGRTNTEAWFMVDVFRDVHRQCAG